MAPTADSLRRGLADIVGESHVVVDPEILRSATTDWTGRFSGRTPCLVRPGSTGEVAEVVRLARRWGVGLVTLGGNTGLVGGAVPDGDVLVSTARLVGVEDIDPDGGQLTALAGTTLADVQAAATEAGWRYGVDMASRGSATIGGTVAADAGGLRVLRFGSTRHQLLGVEAVLGTGEVVRRLGGLRKDNTGYDLAGLLCGSEGTLGIVCRARLALVAPAGATVTALLGFATVAAAVRAVGRLRREVPTLEAAELVLRSGADLVAEHTGASPVLDPPPPVEVVVEAVGPPDPTDSLARAVQALDDVLSIAVATDAPRARQLWHVRESHTEVIARLGVAHKYDVTLPTAAFASFVDEAPALVAGAVPGARTWLFGHVADGNVHVNVTDVPADAATALDDVVLGAVVDRGGSISAEHGVGTAKAAWLGRDRSAAELEAMRSIERALDPDGVLNRRVLFGG